MSVLKQYLTKNALSPAESIQNQFAVRATFRHLLRATGIAFRGDDKMLQASRQLARESFYKNQKFESGSLEASAGVEHAQGVTQILLQNVVQGRNTKPDTYKLNIHEHTQRMDNGTAKESKGTTKSFQQIKIAQF